MTIQIQDAQRELAASEARFMNVVGSSPDGIVVTNSEGVILFANSAAEQLFGRTQEELVGEEFGYPIVGGDTTELSIRNRRGKTTIVAMRVVQIEWERQPALLASLRDVSEYKRLTAELERSNDDLEQFAYAVSHDMKAPLRSMSTFAQLLQEELDSPDAQSLEYLDLIISNSQKMSKLIGSLLEFSRVAGPSKPLEQVSLKDVLHHVLKNLKADIEQNGAEITYGDLPTIACDEMQMVQLFQNLIGNGMKYCEQTPKIRIASERREGHWLLSFTDNGIGVERGQWHKIFEVFARLHSQREYAGTGIGLATCKRIVERHDGQIWIESKLGKGSVFYVILPFETPPPEEIATDRP